jgi:hypothetical protein
MIDAMIAFSWLLIGARRMVARLWIQYFTFINTFPLFVYVACRVCRYSGTLDENVNDFVKGTFAMFNMAAWHIRPLQGPCDKHFSIRLAIKRLPDTKAFFLKNH